ncbi:hypothetical protein QE400_001097 [Xanthomonas sacchari]|nr:hypothetical protein [Xanthomonas sacchari]MDQ1091684.1 hypothetical protein [Xanthomonas sacchari]
MRRATGAAALAPTGRSVGGRDARGVACLRRDAETWPALGAME